MRLSRLTAASAIALATIAISLPSLAAPSAKEKAEARTLAADAKKAMKDKRWSDAVTALKKADKLDPSPALELDLAQALASSGKLLEAVKVLGPLAEGSDNSQQAKKTREAAKKALAEVKARVPSVKVAINGPPAGKASVLVDGLEARGADAIEVDPGSHTIGATAEGFEPAEKEMNFNEGVRAEVELTLKAKAPPPVAEKKTGSRVPGAVLTAIGGAGLVVGGVFGGLAFKATSDAKAQCNGNQCPQSAADDISRSKLYGNVSTAAFIAGGAIAATGIVLLIVAPGGGSSSDEKPKEQSARVAPWMGPGGAGVVVSGAF
jgi:hypothetical protein